MKGDPFLFRLVKMSPKRCWWRPTSQEVVEEGDYLSLHCHCQNDSCIKMGCDVSRFNVSVIVRDKVTKTVSINHNL